MNNTLDNSIPSFLFLSDHENKYFENIDSRLKNNNSQIIKQKFFSDENLNFINKQIVNLIYEKTNFKIPLQNTLIIRQTMIDIFNIHYNYILNNVNVEINKLNKKTIDILIKNILLNLKFKDKFKKDIEDINHIYDHANLPINVSCKGTNEINTQKRIFNLYN